MKGNKALEREIERLRNEMYKAYEKTGSNEHVIRISQELDKQLNQLKRRNEKVD